MSFRFSSSRILIELSTATWGHIIYGWPSGQLDMIFNGGFYFCTSLVNVRERRTRRQNAVFYAKSIFHPVTVDSSALLNI